MSNLGVLGWVLGAVGAAVAIVLYLGSSALKRRLSEAMSEAGSLTEKLEAARKESGARKEELDRAKGELKDAQETLAKNKKKAHKLREELKTVKDESGDTSGEDALQHKLDKMTESFEHARSLAETRASRIEELERELGATKFDRQHLIDQTKDKADNEGDQLRRRIAQLEKNTVDPREVQRYKRRAESVNGAYLLTKGKLEVTEDRMQDLLGKYEQVLNELAALKTGGTADEIRARVEEDARRRRAERKQEIVEADQAEQEAREAAAQAAAEAAEAEAKAAAEAAEAAAKAAAEAEAQAAEEAARAKIAAAAEAKAAQEAAEEAADAESERETVIRRPARKEDEEEAAAAAPAPSDA